MYLIITNKEVSKVGNRCSLGKHVGEGATPLPGLLQFTFCLTKAEEPSLSYYLPIAGGTIIGFIPHHKLWPWFLIV